MAETISPIRQSYFSCHAGVCEDAVSITEHRHEAEPRSPCFDGTIGPGLHVYPIGTKPPFDRRTKQITPYHQTAGRSINELLKGTTPRGCDHVTSPPTPISLSHGICWIEVIRQVKPSGVNSPETLDLSELIRPREA